MITSGTTSTETVQQNNWVEFINSLPFHGKEILTLLGIIFVLAIITLIIIFAIQIAKGKYKVEKVDLGIAEVIENPSSDPKNTVRQPQNSKVKTEKEVNIDAAVDTIREATTILVNKAEEKFRCLRDGSMSSLYYILQSPTEKGPEMIKNIRSLKDLFANILLQFVSNELNDRKMIGIFEPIEIGNNTILKMTWSSGAPSSPNYLSKFSPRTDEGIVGKSFFSKSILFSNDVTKESDFIKNPRSKRIYNSILCIPIIYGLDDENTEIIGCLSIDSSVRNAFKNLDLLFIESFAKLFSFIIKFEKTFVL